MKKKIVKLFSVLFLFIFLVTLSSCGNTQKSVTPTTTRTVKRFTNSIIKPIKQ